MSPKYLRNFKEAEKYLFRAIPKSPKERHPGALGLRRTAFFFKLIGNPQCSYKVVHVAGTSGKGSVSYLLAAALESQGFKVGLFVSPHLLDVRERAQINRQFLPKGKFVKYLNAIIPAARKVDRTQLGHPTYFEILTALALYAFREEKVNYAVVETGLGGTFDATNIIKRKFFVLTKIGFDHTHLLGNTLAKIAAQKAGIIHEKDSGLSIAQPRPAEKAILSAVRAKNANIEFIDPGKNFTNVKISRNGTQFDFRFGSAFLPRMKIGLLGEYQAENAGLALAALFSLSRRDNFSIKISALKKELSKSHFPGRFDIFRKPKLIILDGAHNPQKMEAFTESVKKIFPNKKFEIVLAFKKGKDYAPMLRNLLPVARTIICSGFFNDSQDMKRMSEEPRVLEEILKKMSFKRVRVEPDPKKAFRLSLESKNPVLVTGSLYFIAEIYPYLKHLKSYKM